MSVADLRPLTERFGLDATARGRLELLAARLADDPHAPTTVRDPARVRDDHLADALVALELAPIRHAQRILDLGAGAGVPGLPLAVALPEAEMTLVDAVARKCVFMRELAAQMGLDNVQVRHARAEELPERDHWDVITARALAPLGVIAEYAAPLLCMDGALVAWRGQPEPQLEPETGRALEILGLEVTEIRQVWPFEQAQHRYLQVVSKLSPTPPRFPRRVGMARKRPLGA